jgi:fructose-1,6-bisphosphatase/inositol monophosphatase family enzyme
MRAMLRKHFPTHGVFGEEGGMQAGHPDEDEASYLWVLDPIDGTKSFITGSPLSFGFCRLDH